jgi:cobaltochelatase CobN
MSRRWLFAWLLLVVLGCGPAQARELLWVTGDVTPAARTALVERLAVADGWTFRHSEQPLSLPAGERPDARRQLAQAVAAADMVWVDAPHASIEALLADLLGTAAKARHVVWIGAEGKPGGEPLAEYLRHGGEANTRHALTLAARRLAGQTGENALAGLPPPRAWPRQGLYHPDAADFFADVDALQQWRPGARPAVALLVHRHHFINGETAWLDDWLRRFAARGLFAYAVFGQQLDARGLRELLVAKAERRATGPEKAHPDVLVLHQLASKGGELQTLFTRWQVPVLSALPYRHGDTAAWQADPTGLRLADTPFYLFQPEAAGAIDPLIVASYPGERRPAELIARQAEAVIAKAARLIALQRKAKADKRVVAMVYNYPAGGSNFGASFLNVPRSLENVSAALVHAGYRTQSLPESAWVANLQPLLRAYYSGADLRALLADGYAAALPLRDYKAWWDAQPAVVRQRIAAHWGPPETSRYVVDWQGEPVFVIPRLQLGNVAVLPQPPREETLHRGQNPFAHKSGLPLSHHYLAVYLWARQADALIHFGTHGTQEWAGGKARGLDVKDDALLPLGDVPVIYPYIVDNLGEALTAKRRGRALLLSHRTPVLATTGLAPGMGQLHELMHQWAIADDGPTKQAVGARLLALIVDNRLHHDLKWPVERVRQDLDAFLEALHPWLDQLAHGSQPRGLAVFGAAPEPALRRQMILQTLRTPLLDALGEDVDETFLMDYRHIETSRPMRWLQAALIDAEAASRLDLRAEANASAVPNRAGTREIDSEALRALAVRAQALDRLFSGDNEMPALLAALDGRFIPAAYGGDPIRNPDSLPTGRNLVGLDPSRLPTQQAYTVAQLMFDQWLADWREKHGNKPPERLALSLWAGETLRHQGVMEAQALVALGVRPVWDEAGRPRSVSVIPADELGRPRVDVLLSVTGSYRDQFPALMALVDAAVAAVATAEPEGAIARHSRTVAGELRRHGASQAVAEGLGRARVFGNASGDYGTGIADAVLDDRLKPQDERLGQLFLQRMSQPYVDGVALADVAPALAEQALGAQLRRTDAALLSRSSHLYGMVTSDDPFQYLGGLAAAARSAGRKAPLELFVSQLQNADEPHAQTAQQSIAMEMQARYLHPGWVAALQKEGYAGTLQVLKAAQFAWGWQSVVDDAVRADHWQGLHDVFVKDKHGLGVPDWLRSHPQAYAQTLERLIQAARHKHWTPDAATRQELAKLYRELTAAAPLAQPSRAVEAWVAGELPGTPRDKISGVARLVAGATPQPASPDAAAGGQTAEAYQPVRGEKLARRPDTAPALPAWLALLLFLPLVGGALRQRVATNGNH